MQIDVSYFTLELLIENLGLLDAEDVRAGVLSWSVRTPAPGDTVPEVPSSLLSYVREVRKPEPYGVQVAQPLWSPSYTRANHVGKNLTAPSAPIPAFEQGLYKASVRWPVFPVLGASDPPRGLGGPSPFELASDRDRTMWRRGRVRHGCAAFVVAKNNEPIWYQLWIEYEGPSRPKAGVGPMSPPRPIVAFAFVGQGQLG